MKYNAWNAYMKIHIYYGISKLLVEAFWSDIPLEAEICLCWNPGVYTVFAFKKQSDILNGTDIFVHNFNNYEVVLAKISRN